MSQPKIIIIIICYMARSHRDDLCCVISHIYCFQSINDNNNNKEKAMKTKICLVRFFLLLVNIFVQKQRYL
ncbi:hypothetical protein DERP_001821 [Dermatophagoides pteronyssinus]|uniref:Uncharacterized protein n=1 Tax=Dermatophagoides pteronyssinus TaxID=6956 RepID=A0ABQ8JC47_DERPT|nr:hypothetical protein DERP_001821 [Dermatophagoides pteronyssinus]